MYSRLNRIARISLWISVGLMLAAAMPGDPIDVVFCPDPGLAISQQTWSQGASAYTSDPELISTLVLEGTSLGDMGSRHLVCTYRLEDEAASARFHLRMQMPDSYSCTASGQGAFVCRIRW